jgi:hypothetical protein
MGNDALVIALAILDTDSDDRGQLFMEIADELRKRDQFYTASLFVMIAKIYGVKDG